MKLVTYRLADFEGSEMIAFGAIRGDEVVRLDVSVGHDHAGLGSVDEYLAGLPHTFDRASAIVRDRAEPGVPIADVHLYPALQHPPTVLVCSADPDGRIDTEALADPFISGPGDRINLHEPGSARFGLRPQLGVVSAQDTAIAAVEAKPAGYVIFNEVISHEMESGARSIGVGIGPYLVTPDEVPDPLALEVAVTFENRQRWHGSTSGYALRPPDMLFELHRRYTFRPGTLIGLGTIPGSFGLDGAEWLDHGESFIVTIDGLGALPQRFGPR
jgi:hypothetical protein